MYSQGNSMGTQNSLLAGYVTHTGLVTHSNLGICLLSPNAHSIDCVGMQASRTMTELYCQA